MESYDELLTKANRSQNATDIAALLKFMRLNRVRESRLTCELGGRALSKLNRALGDERWPICEQVFIASLDTGDDELAIECLTKLLEQFKDSARVKRLRGLEYEARREFDKAGLVYKDLIEANPANALAMKRSVSILKSKGDMKGAVKELNTFLEKFQADASAWQELASLYMSLSKYDSAAFCFEELILSDPMNHMKHCRLAEIYYTMGREHYAAARKHFSQSLDIKSTDNARALHGLAACCHAIAEDTKLSRSQKGRPEVNSALMQFASTELKKAYREGKGALSKEVDSLLELRSASVED